MAAPSPPGTPAESRAQRIAAILQALLPHLDAVMRRLVERAVDVPEAEGCGAIGGEFRDAGLERVNAVRQAAVASRKKRAT